MMHVPGQNAHEERVSVADSYKKRIAELEDQLNRPVLKTEWQQAQDRIAELEAEAKGGDIMAAKDAERIAELEEEIKRLSRTGVALHEAKHQIAELEAQIRRMGKAWKVERDQLKAQLAEAQKDAGRYRWLRDKAMPDELSEVESYLWEEAEELNAAIDAAMESEK